MNYTCPPKIAAEQVFRKLGHHWTCPYCKVESTNASPGEDIGWIEVAVRRSGPPYICFGCCIDIYSTCASSDFDSHAYRDIVQEAAAIEGISVETFRKTCVEDQLHSIEDRAAAESPYEYLQLHQYLVNLLNSISD